MRNASASEAAVLKSQPLLINKIIAERLSDKIQVMMVPSDGKFFFANDVLRASTRSPAVQQETGGETMRRVALRAEALSEEFVRGCSQRAALRRCGFIGGPERS